MGKVLIADSSSAFSDVLVGVLERKHTVISCAEGNRVLRLVESFRPQVVILSLMLPGLDGFAVIDAIADRPDPPKILVLTYFINDFIHQELCRRPVAYAMMKPCSIEALEHRVEEMLGTWEKPVEPPAQNADPIDLVLYRLGISPLSLCGRYAHAGIEAYLENTDMAITKELYPTLARKLGKTPMSVEKALRQGIAQAWEHRDETVWRWYFDTMPDGTMPKPTNQQFLQRLARCLQQAEESRCG